MASYREMAGMLGAFVRSILAGNPPAPNSSLMIEAQRLMTEAVRGLRAPTAWTPFEERTLQQRNPEAIQRVAEKHGLTVEVVTRFLQDQTQAYSIWVNSRYQVLRRQFPSGVVHLSIKRLDQEPIHDWRDLQRLKNELIGAECEAVELFPAMSRLADAANQYHLWGVATPDWRFPLGYRRRFVAEASDTGEHQRSFEAGWLDADSPFAGWGRQAGGPDDV